MELTCNRSDDNLFRDWALRRETRCELLKEVNLVGVTLRLGISIDDKLFPFTKERNKGETLAIVNDRHEKEKNEFCFLVFRFLFGSRKSRDYGTDFLLKIVIV